MFLPDGYLQSCRWQCKCLAPYSRERTEIRVPPRQGLNAVHRSARSPEEEENNVGSQTQKPKFICTTITILMIKYINIIGVELKLQTTLSFASFCYLTWHKLASNHRRSAPPIENAAPPSSIPCSSHWYTWVNTVTSTATSNGSWLCFHSSVGSQVNLGQLCVNIGGKSQTIWSRWRTALRQEVNFKPSLTLGE